MQERKQEVAKVISLVKTTANILCVSSLFKIKVYRTQFSKIDMITYYILLMTYKS